MRPTLWAAHFFSCEFPEALLASRSCTAKSARAEVFCHLTSCVFSQLSPVRTIAAGLVFSPSHSAAIVRGAFCARIQPDKRPNFDTKSGLNSSVYDELSF